MFKIASRQCAVRNMRPDVHSVNVVVHSSPFPNTSISLRLYHKRVKTSHVPVGRAARVPSTTLFTLPSASIQIYCTHTHIYITGMMGG